MQQAIESELFVKRLGDWGVEYRGVRIRGVVGAGAQVTETDEPLTAFELRLAEMELLRAWAAAQCKVAGGAT